jgi:SAM-dependent methyltransferase
MPQAREGVVMFTDEDQGNYLHRSGVRDPGGSEDPFHDSAVVPMFTDEQLESAVTELRCMLEEDQSVRTQEALKGEMARQIQSVAQSFPNGHWFQRIDYPGHHITSTSNHEWAHIDEGGLNTLGKRLSGREASILRPWPKWLYLKNLLPDVAGKSVVEIGSSNGFFCFRFSELGAAHATGIEIKKRQYESAVWSAEVLGLDNVSFIHTDFLLDMTIPQYDVVFSSEVHNHFLFPFYGLLRMINLAKETVILDTGVIDTKDHRLGLDSGWDQSNQLLYHSFMLSDGLIMDFLDLIGIPPSRVKRYKAPADHYHILYVIDTTDLSQHRIKFSYPDYLTKVIGLRFKK